MSAEEKQVADRLKEAANVLVTVNSNPTVDQLAACIGLTLALNKLGKHAAAVFSGKVPSTLEFLKPEDTLEKNTDSLRDFIISLDKSKADKLRYKVEDNVVKIFITPYHTAINESDFEYSQGDFNVEVVVALGVRSQPELDQAITTHGRILHDATVVSMNLEPGAELGSINIINENASSLSEMVTQLVQAIDSEALDSQIATALLTGVVAETNRFSNEKTTPTTMSVSSSLMAAGANQQLVATKLDEPQTTEVIDESHSNDMPILPAEEAPQQLDEKPKEPGTLEIAHDTEVADQSEKPEEKRDDQIQVDEEGLIQSLPEAQDTQKEHDKKGRMVLEPLGEHESQFTANTQPERTDVAGDLSLPPVAPVGEGHGLVLEPLTKSGTASEKPLEELLKEANEQEITGAGTTEEKKEEALSDEPKKPFNLSEALEEAGESDITATPLDSMYLPTESEPQEKTTAAVPKPGETLADLELDVHSPHVQTPPAQTGEQQNGDQSSLDSARRAVEDAMAAAGTPDQQPVNPLVIPDSHTVDLGFPVQEVESAIPPAPVQPALSANPFETMPAQSAADQPLQMPQPQFAAAPVQQQPVGDPFAHPVIPTTPTANPLAPPAPAAAPVVNPFADSSAPVAPQQPDPNAPPLVPPPMMPTNFGPPR